MRGTMVRNPAPPSFAPPRALDLNAPATQKTAHTGSADPPISPRSAQVSRVYWTPAARECQTCGISNLASDWASPDLYPVVLPPFAAGGWALFLAIRTPERRRSQGAVPRAGPHHPDALAAGAARGRDGSVRVRAPPHGAHRRRVTEPTGPTRKRLDDSQVASPVLPTDRRPGRAFAVFFGTSSPSHTGRWMMKFVT